MNFYKCPICGNIVYLMEGKIANVKCCGSELELLVANTQDAALEKHVPVYEVIDDKINVVIGSVEHPMSEEHYISFIAQVYDNKVNFVKLDKTESPKAEFPYIKGSKIYEYCNLHGLWVKEVE